MNPFVLRIEVASHFFRVLNPTPRAIPVIMRFCQNYTLYNWVKTGRGRPQYQAVKVFATRTFDNNEFRFHIGQLEDFLIMLEKDYIVPSMYDITYRELYTPQAISVDVNPNYVLREEQVQVRDFIVNELDGDHRSRLVALSTGSGKAQPLTARIKIPGGWSTMGAMQVGTAVIARDGSIAKVKGVYPQGKKEVYRITFKDGRSTEASGDHLWKVYFQGWKDKARVITTEDIQRLKSVHYMKDRLYIDLYEPEKNDDFFAELKEVSTAFIEHRGILKKDGTIVIPVTQEAQALRLQYLIRSLGGLAKIRLGAVIEGKVIFEIQARCEVLNSYQTHKTKLRLGIRRIEKIGSKEVQCIEIDHPEQLYVTDDFIVTHNTVISLISAADLGQRVLINILPTYIDRWLDALKDILNCKEQDILVIQGASSLKDLIDLAMEGRLEAKFIILSLRTIQNYIKAYEENPYELELEGYQCVPDELCKLLGIGTVIIDETHQHLHAVFKFLTYTHVPKVVALSATLMSDDSTVERIQHKMFPRELRFNSLTQNKYIKCYAVAYSFNDIYQARIQTTQYGSKNYSHTAYEKSLMRRHYILKHYSEMIDYFVQLGYLDSYQPQDKLIIFVATIVMADHLTRYLSSKYPHLDVRRYVEQDPFENVMEADIRVTTILSAGTAIDIQQLTCAIQTVNLRSSVSNIQSLGRLRKLKDRDVRFYFLYCNQIPKHHEYYRHRLELFYTRAESIKDFKYPYPL